MNFSIVTIFPDMLRNFITHGLLAKAIENRVICVDVYDLRDFTANKHLKVDDRPFGGGPGMVMMPQPLFAAVEFIKSKKPGRVILFSAYARILNQAHIKDLAREDHLILVCGRYEGVDQRFIDTLVDEEISLGEFVLMGGEAAAEVLLEGVSRMLPGVVGNPLSVESDSFFREDQYGFPQYTQPRDFRDLTVPDILLSGNHKEILDWRKKNEKRSES